MTNLFLIILRERHFDNELINVLWHIKSCFCKYFTSHDQRKEENNATSMFIKKIIYNLRYYDPNTDFGTESWVSLLYLNYVIQK